MQSPKKFFRLKKFQPKKWKIFLTFLIASYDIIILISDLLLQQQQKKSELRAQNT
jgi:hypothetical protein